MDLIKDLEARGLIEHTSAPLEKIFEKKRTVYLGVDPTADSMQAGNLVLVMLLRRLADAGHKIILLVGGGTGLIGDPKEKGERVLSDTKIVEANKKAIKKQFEKLIAKKVPLVDNAEWLTKVKLIDFLRDIGKHFTVNELVKRDIIKRRLETPDESISYTEFAYSLLQGYDFLLLNRTYGCDLQIGGSDQWANILSGVELIRRKDQKEAFALTCPLVTDAQGKKFGKSEGNAVWLDEKKTSPFAFYQFFLTLPDEGIEKFLKMYTFMPVLEIDALLELHRRNPGERRAQETLAREVTSFVHGSSAAETAGTVSQILFGSKSIDTITERERQLLLKEAPSVEISYEELGKISIDDILITAELASSKGDARRLINAGGVSINETMVSTSGHILTERDFSNNIALVRKGKREMLVLVLK